MYQNFKTGITTIGATGILIVSGVIYADLNPWWLVLGVFCITSAIGLEHGQKRD